MCIYGLVEPDIFLLYMIRIIVFYKYCTHSKVQQPLLSWHPKIFVNGIEKIITLAYSVY